MTMPPGFRGEVDIREEIDVVSVDPLFIERQRNRYASRGLAYIVLLNGLAAIALLISLAHGTSSTESTKRFADAMMVFGIGAAAGLASALFAYFRRTVGIQLPRQVTERRFFGLACGSCCDYRRRLFRRRTEYGPHGSNPRRDCQGTPRSPGGGTNALTGDTQRCPCCTRNAVTRNKQTLIGAPRLHGAIPA
jgi:hypothetical protein